MEEGERGPTHLEVGGQNGREALAQLQQVIRRVADQWRPASAEESFAIVRRRLFEEPGADAQADIAAVARVFTEFYARHRGEFPNGVAEPGYEERIKAAYPIHPELFDRLYQDWSTLERFQRTRGVLRLMSAVIHSLWLSTDPAPLIMPGGVPLDSDEVLTEIAQYLEDNFKPVIDTDVDGTDPTPAKIDVSRPTFGQRRITRRIARTIFLGSASTLRAAHKGIEQPFIWLGVATPGDQVGNFGSALHMLSEQATYLYNDGTRYWYDVAPTVARMARDHADRLRERPDKVHDKILERLRKHEQRTRGMFAQVQTGPDNSSEIPDNPVARLVILHPQYRHSRNDAASEAMVFCDKALNYSGSARRLNRNMIVFLAPDAKRYEELDAAVREYLAWQNIAESDERMEELGLSAQQRTQAKKSLTEADEKVRLRIPATYQWVLVPVQPKNQQVYLDELKADTAKERLADRASDKLYNADRLRVIHGARLIRLDLDEYLSTVWNLGHIRVSKLWEYYCQHPYLPRLAERSVLDHGIVDVFDVLTWDHHGFAVAASFDESAGKYDLLCIPREDAPPQITDSTLLVRPERAIAQRKEERATQEAARAGAGSGTMEGTPAGVTSGHGSPGSALPPGATPGAPPGPKSTRFYGVAKINSDLYMKELTKLSQEIIQHLASDDADVEICVEITAQKNDGFPDDKVRIVTENARTLKFDSYGFEDR